MATCTAAPLLWPFVVTIAVRLVPFDNDDTPDRLVTVRLVLVADVTVPVTLLLNVTELLPAVVLKLVPVIVMLVALASRLAVDRVTVGADAPPDPAPHKSM